MTEQVLVVKREKIEQYIDGRNGLIRDNTEKLRDIIMNTSFCPDRRQRSVRISSR